MRSAERLTRLRALAALRPAGPPPTTMTSYAGDELSGIVSIVEVVARRSKKLVTRAAFGENMMIVALSSACKALTQVPFEAHKTL